MIQDPTAAKEIQASWQGVRTLKDKTSAAITGSVAMGGTFTIFIADAAHNLPFLHACSVLNETLIQLRDEGHFKCQKFFLGALVKSSVKNLPWTNYPLIEEVVEKRNKVAHRGKILPRADCWRYIDAIENELLAWKVISS